MSPAHLSQEIHQSTHIVNSSTQRDWSTTRLSISMTMCMILQDLIFCDLSCICVDRIIESCNFTSRIATLLQPLIMRKLTYMDSSQFKSFGFVFHILLDNSRPKVLHKTLPTKNSNGQNLSVNKPNPKA